MGCSRVIAGPSTVAERARVALEATNRPIRNNVACRIMNRRTRGKPPRILTRSSLQDSLMKLIQPALAAVVAAVLGAGAVLYTLTCYPQGLEIISLRHRTVEQVLPALRPLLEPGGTMTGQSNQLIV